MAEAIKAVAAEGGMNEMVGWGVFLFVLYMLKNAEQGDKLIIIAIALVGWGLMKK